MTKKLRFVYFIFVFLGLAPFSAEATHIVGGHPEVVHLRGTTYRFGLTLFFDEINGEQGAKDPYVSIGVFDKKLDGLRLTLRLPLQEEAPVPYTNSDCALPQLQTSRLYYYTDVTLSRETLGDPEGYYFVWERCCRNGVITNIQNPGATGQTFFMEFPGLKDEAGNAFLNSSPTFRPVVADYPCVGRPFTLDFGGEDPDGDSLVYSLTIPLAGFSTPAEPVPNPEKRPHSPVNFVSGIDETIQIPGTPSLGVDAQTGLLRVTPSAPGLYVFAIKVEEFRDGKRIGSTHREFQVLVQDCPPAQAPEISFLPEGQSDFYLESEILKLGQGNCGLLRIQAPEGETPGRLFLRAIGFAGVGQPPVQEIVLTEEGYEVEICFPECPEDDFFVLEVVAEDENCPQPLTDTLRIRAGGPISGVLAEVPNVFTPNGDGKNDRFFIPALAEEALATCPTGRFYIEIYNRWGKQVFSAQQRDFAWSGEGFPAGVYNYLIFLNGETYKGTVSLLRE